MNLCYYCQKGHLEMCEYFKENFLEREGAVSECPVFEEDPEMEKEESADDHL